MLKNIINRVIMPEEVKETIKYIKSYLKENATFSRDIIENQALKLAKDSDKTINFVSKQHKHPEHLALLLITNVIAGELSKKKISKEKKHIAQDMLELWDLATEDMRNKLYYSDMEYRRDCDWIDKRCKWLRTNVMPIGRR